MGTCFFSGSNHNAFCSSYPTRAGGDLPPVDPTVESPSSRSSGVPPSSAVQRSLSPADGERSEEGTQQRSCWGSGARRCWSSRLLLERNDLCLLRTGVIRRPNLPQRTGINVPVLPCVRYHRHRLLVVSGQYS